MLVTDAGQILVTGYCKLLGSSMPYLAAIDPNGTLLWVHVYDQVVMGWPYSLCATADGGYALFGQNYMYDFLLIKVDVDGEGYECARRYMIRLAKADFENPDRLQKVAAVMKVKPEQFRERFGYLVGV